MKFLIDLADRADSDGMPIQDIQCGKEIRVGGQIRVILPCRYLHGWGVVFHTGHPRYAV